jgi:hypothetical protein
MMFPAKVVEKVKKLIARAIIFFPPRNRGGYEIMWKKYDRAG